MGQDVEIPIDMIKTNFDGVRASMTTVMKFTFRLPKDNQDVSFDFTTIRAELSLMNDNSNSLLSETIKPFSLHLFDREEVLQPSLTFTLDDKALFAIEKTRNGGDVRLKITFRFNTLRKEALRMIEGEITWSVDRPGDYGGDIHFVIPKSIWIENLLPKFGHPGFRLIEIPVKHSLIKEAYDDIIAAFDAAQEYFNKGDYKTCVANCRHAIDLLNRNLIKIKTNVPSESKFKWLNAVDQATLTWIDEIDKSLSAVMAPTHHLVGLKKEYTRIEAESIYLVTLALMNFVGQASSDFSN